MMTKIIKKKCEINYKLKSDSQKIGFCNTKDKKNYLKRKENQLDKILVGCVIFYRLANHKVDKFLIKK